MFIIYLVSSLLMFEDKLVGVKIYLYVCLHFQLQIIKCQVRKLMVTYRKPSTFTLSKLCVHCHWIIAVTLTSQIKMFIWPRSRTRDPGAAKGPAPHHTRQGDVLRHRTVSNTATISVVPQSSSYFM